ncbi:pilus assembly protein [Reyranella sp. CPCC 100927]|uniref:pilus assembly protein n=1 Tax=Reyranella sp. CPCC 100927 TaxID=2599616 RepID=UPI0011B7A495|nr:pilus assembly protein [Reyranella sp. CPCC 100927]TWT10220.1 VWA domain-containing protein [Reyranella sp. CPCC 100927]
MVLWAVTKLRSTIRGLRHAREGTTLIIVAVAAPVVIGGVALAVDTGIWYMEKRKTQQMADAATIGAVRIIKDGGSVATARQVALNDAKRNGYAEATGNSFVLNSPVLSGPYAGQANTVEVIISRKLPRFFHPAAATVGARSVAYKPVVLGKNLEVALMLDVSGSMNGDTEVPNVTKLKAMQDAAKALVDTVVQNQQTPYTSRVALVPYSSAVNVGSDSVGNTTLFKAVTNKDIPTTTSGWWPWTTTIQWTSVVERSGTAQYTDDLPTTGKWLGDFYSHRNWNVNTNQPSSSSRIRSLSTDKESLKATIGGLTAGGSTAGHLGTAWTWYLLSPKWSSVWTGGSAPNAYNPANTNKAVVLLSDFDMNTYYAGSDSSAVQTRKLCTAMKNAGIVIFTVGYKVPANNSTANDLWNNCASDANKVFSADTVSELLAAFKAIAQATLNGALNDDISLGE